MKLELEVSDAQDADPVSSASKTFDGVGGVIGRGAGCDWIVPDSNRLLSSHHGLIAYREGRYFLTDISSNGIDVVGSNECLRKGQARVINDGDEFQFGLLTIRARLIERAQSDNGLTYSAAESIPDDAFLALDPVQALDSDQLRKTASHDLDALNEAPAEHLHCLSHAAVDRDHMGIPRVAEPAQEVLATHAIATPPADELFWDQFSAALGIRLETFDGPAREALAIRVARLFRLGVESLRQSLRTCEELKAELNLPALDPPLKSRNPLKDGVDTDAALAAMLGAGCLGQIPAEQAVIQVHRDLQVHQVALLAACQGALRNTRAAFAPGHLLTCFHYQEKQPRFSTDGGHWRAYQRHYQKVMAQVQRDDHSPGGDFTRIYEEQVRLISTLQVDYPG